MPFIGNQPALSYTSFAKQDFTTSATTSYTLDQPVANENEIALFINFVRQEPTTAYTASGTSLTLTSATSASDDMYCVFLGKAVQTVNPPNSSVGNSQLDVSAINSQTAETSIAGGDEVLIYDTSASALRKMTRTNFTSGLGGLTHYQNFNRTTDQSVSADTDTTITFGNEETGERIGSALVTESSGVFSFSATGYYLVNYFLSGEMQSNSGTSRQAKAFHQTSSNAGSSYTTNTFMSTNIADADGGEKDNMFIYNSFLYDVTDTTNNRLKIIFRLQSNPINILGGTTTEFTHIQFMKVAET